MKLHPRGREIILWRRERAELEAAGYRMHETDWELNRGYRWREMIVDVKISRCGKYVYTKLGPRP